MGKLAPGEPGHVHVWHNAEVGDVMIMEGTILMALRWTCTTCDKINWTTERL